MKAENLIELYERWKQDYGKETYRHVSAILQEAKTLHYADWVKSPTANNDHEQSWRAFKGKNLEKLVIHIIQEQVEDLGLRIVHGSTLERTRALPGILSKVQRNLSVRFVVGNSSLLHLPDVDIIIYEPLSAKIVAVISSKVTLRERIAQTGYWKLKLSSDETTKLIKVFFVTPDEDGTLLRRKPMKKGRAIVEVDTDGAYLMTERDVDVSDKVKRFDDFIDDLRKLLS